MKDMTLLVPVYVSILLLTTVPAGRRLFVEVKCGPEILPALDAVFTASGKRHQMVVIGFELATMERSKQVMPDVPAYWLCDTFLGAPFGRGLVARAVAAGVDGVNVQFSGVTTRFATVVRNAGLEFYTWTLDRPIDALRLQQLGVNGITTNRPGWLRERLSGPAMLAESRATAGAAPAPRS
jgi:glycerophosphoryl diester phosphodiesterase